MDCAHVREMLADYSVALVGGRRRKALEQHLAACPECAAELRALQRTAELVEMLPAQAPPDGLWDGLSYRLARESRQSAVRVRPRPAPLWLRPAIALATAALAAVGFWESWSGSLPPPTPPEVASSYVQAHLANSPTDVLGGEISRGLVLAESTEIAK
jgi:anti-sigma factor RsiW